MSPELKDWKKWEIWYMQAPTFEVAIHHWNHSADFSVWNVYAIIGPKHPRFRRGSKADDELPLHGGVTFQGQAYGNSPGRKVGCDYTHYGDKLFQAARTPEEVPQVFRDAWDLFQFLNLEQIRGMSPIPNETDL